MTETLWAPGAGFATALAEAAALTDAALDRLIAPPDGLEARVFEAMRYAALAPGKRLRPFLVMASARLFARLADALPAGGGGDRAGACLFAGA